MEFLFLILSTSIFMSLIILLATVAFILWPQALSGKTRYIIWIIILIGLIVPFRPIWGNGLFQIETPFPQSEINLPVTEEITLTDEHSKTSNNQVAVKNETALPEKPMTTAGSDMVAVSSAPKSGFSLSIVSIILLIWAIGAIFSFSRHLYSYYQFRKMVKRWGVPVTDLATLELFDIVKEDMGLQRKNIQLIQCTSITTPMLTGFLKPTILLPNKNIEADEMELIFEHELTHYKHKDLYVNLLGTLAVSLHWFNPIVYFCYPSIQGDGEVCCDEAVLSNRDLDYRRFYGEVIISMIERNNTKQVAFSTCFYAKKLNIKRRLFAIMETNKRRKTISFMAIGLILTLIIVSGSIVAFGAPSSNNYIGVDAAKTIALNDAGLAPSEAIFIKAKLDTDLGVKVYDIEFYSGNTEYDYEIDAKTGVIRERDFDIANFVIPAPNTNTGNTQNNNAALIGTEKAKAIALADAKLNADQVTSLKAKLGTDDGIQVYDVEFFSGNTKYDYEIDAKTGKIRDKDVEVKKNAPAQNNNNNSNAPLIGVEKAKAIALADAKLNANQVTFLKAKLDTDDGVQVYDVEFYSGNTEYDYEIDAKTGKIRDKDLDIENFNIPAPAPSNDNTALIGVEKAKAIALADAKLNASQVTFLKAKLDTDDGVQVYDIEFYSGNTEYDYEIDAKTGKIREKDLDVENFNIPTPAPGNDNTALIGVEKAKAIALAHAGLNANQVVFETAKLDTDDGVQVYDIDFKAGQVEYDYEIDAKTGNIRDFSKEIDD
ncbi:peptidase M56 [Clostridiales bacterium COT073_COT-073]|nr:peptidase M56 [Clostridiales bacterium COT073_COT-073]